jgi:hypothetical protein
MKNDRTSPETETLLALAKDCELYAKVIEGIIVVDDVTCANERREPKTTLLKAAAALRGLAPCPDQSALRAAAERVCWFDWSGNDIDACAAIDALRKAIVSDSSTDRQEDTSA